MRLVTWLGLITRRVWSKRGILVGSFLGATLVTALLAIVPLYEASVQAVDLLFTLRGAPASDVDITASSPTNDYSGGTATANRELVAEKWAANVAEWYPTVIERTQSREFLVIPIEGSVDWVAMAEAWQQDYDELVLAGTPEDELPAPPYPTPPQEATQVRFFTAPDITDRLEAAAGALPPAQLGVGSGYASPLQIAVGSQLAATIGVDPGDRFVLKPFSGFPSTFEIVEVAALVDAVDPDDDLWGIDDPTDMVYLDQATWDAWTGALGVDPADDPWRRTQRGLTGTTANQRFIAQFEPTTVQLEELGALTNAVEAFRAEVARDSGGTIQSNSFLRLLLEAFSTRSVTVGAPILSILALVVGGALYFLVYTAALTLEREGPEMALLRTRGASTWQTVGIHIAQSLAVAAVAAALAPAVARALVGVTGRIPPLSDLTGGEPLPVAQVRSMVPFVAAGALLTFVAMGLAVVPFARRKVLELRSLAARPGTTSVWQRYNLDLFAIALSLVILFQLSQRGFINLTADEVKLDPLAIVFPALLLFTGALLVLRILPWLLRFAGWLMTKSRSMSAALPGWHLGRNPIPYGRLALLVWLTTGLGAFALTYAATLDSSFQDRAAFVAGADLRIVGDNAGLLIVEGNATGTAALRLAGAPRGADRQAEVLAIRPEEFSRVVTWRSDFGPPPEETFGPLRADGRRPDVGVELPEDATAFRVDAAVVPLPLANATLLGDGAADQSLRLLMKVFDADGRLWTMQADQDIVDTEWRTIEVDLTTGLNTTYPTPPTPPLSIHTIWVERSDLLRQARVNDERVLLDGFRIVTNSGEEDVTPLLDELSTTNGLGQFRDQPASQARDVYYSELPQGVDPPTAAELAASPLSREGTVQVWQLPTARTRTNPAVPALRRIPDNPLVLLDRGVASRAGLSIGDVSSYGIGDQILTGELVGFLGDVPTMTDGRRLGSMVIDLDAWAAWTDGVASWSFQSPLSRIDVPNELWVATDDADAARRRLLAQYPAGQEPDVVFSIAGTQADFSSRPVQVGLVAILFVGAAVSVVLALAGVTGYVLIAVARRTREMGVLRALGLQRSQVAATFAVEQVVVLGLGAFVGTIGGIALMWAMLPFLQLGEAAEIVKPSIQLNAPWRLLVGYVAIVGVLLIFSVVWSTRRVSVRRMSEVLREVER